MKILYAAAIVALASPALADPIVVTDIELPYNDTLQLTAPVSVDAYVGRQVLTTSTGTILDAWCIDLFADDAVGAGQSLPFTTSPTLTNGQGVPLTAVQVSQIGGLAAYGDAVLAGKLVAPADLNDFSASIQLAIWQDEYAGFAYDGDLMMTALVANDRTVAAGYSSNSLELVSLNGGQDLVIDPVPEPASLVILGCGLLGLGLMRRSAR